MARELIKSSLKRLWQDFLHSLYLLLVFLLEDVLDALKVPYYPAHILDQDVISGDYHFLLLLLLFCFFALIIFSSVIFLLGDRFRIFNS